MIYKALILMLSLFAFTACYYDSEEYLYPDTTQCDTLSITYENFVAELLSTQCNSCHNASTPSGNVITSDFSNVLIIINNGKLKGSVNHLPGFSSMPKGGNKLPGCDLAKINAWLNAGHPEN